MEANTIISNWSVAQKAGALMPCPRCGKVAMKSNLYENALSRRADIYICDKCGMEEALEDVPYSQKANVEFFKKPLDEWFAVMTVFGEGSAERSIDGGFFVNARISFKIEEEEIDDIMAAALEGGITYWCNKAEVGEDDYYGEYASEQISRGGTLILHDYEGGEKYVLTLGKFLKGMSLLVEKGYDTYNAVSPEGVDTCEIDGEIADRIVQLALFGDVIYG